MIKKGIPVPDNDWQALNVRLEEIAKEVANAKISVPVEAPVEEIVQDPVYETPVDMGKIKDSDQFYTQQEEADMNFDDISSGYSYSHLNDTGVKTTSQLGESVVSQSVSSSYFLDLRIGMGADGSKLVLTCDYATVRDSDGNTKALGLLSLDFDIETVGINGMRSGITVATYTWYYLYIVHGAYGTGLLGEDSLTPTLPVGYNTHYARVGSFCSWSGVNLIYPYVQRNDHVYLHSPVARVDSSVAPPGVVNTWTALDMTGYIPATAKEVLLFCGSAKVHALIDLGLGVANDEDTASHIGYEITLPRTGAAALVYGLMYPTFVQLPLINGLTTALYWKVSDNGDNYYGIYLIGFIDDI